jgi:hypothetical protein
MGLQYKLVKAIDEWCNNRTDACFVTAKANTVLNWGDVLVHLPFGFAAAAAAAAVWPLK